MIAILDEHAERAKDVGHRDFDPAARRNGCIGVHFVGFILV